MCLQIYPKLLSREASLTPPLRDLELTTRNVCPQVQKGSPAELAGLADDDIIIEVNGVNVLDESYEKVVDRVQSSGKSVTLLVCGKKAYEEFQAKKIPIVSSMADPVDAQPGPEGGASAEPEPSSHATKERVSDATWLP